MNPEESHPRPNQAVGCLQCAQLLLYRHSAFEDRFLI
jgi:hypothetical protein